MSLINPLATANTLLPASATLNLRESREQNLRSDQVIKVSVLEGGLEKALLQLGSRQVWVDTERPLSTGQKVALRLVRTARGLEFHLLPMTLEDRVRQVIHLAGTPFELLPLLEDLADPANPLTRQLSPESRDAIRAGHIFFAGQTRETEGRYLKSLIRVLGLDLEQRLEAGNAPEALTSLKGVCLELLTQTKDREDPAIERVRKLYRVLEAHQIFRLRLAESGMFLLPLPLPLCEYGFLVAERQPRLEESEGHGAPCLLSLYLSLSSLGALNVDMLFEPRGLSLRIRCETTTVMEYLKGKGAKLGSVLKTCELVNLSFSCDARAAQAHLVTLLGKGGDAGLNARV